AAEKLTHINYAFANIKDGLMVEGYAGDPENYRTLNNLKERNPQLKILVSVGGWTWSGGFSDMALTPQSRKRFIDSAVDETLPGLRRQGHVGEPSGPRPPAHGDEYFQLGITLLEVVQGPVILRIASVPLH